MKIKFDDFMNEYREVFNADQAVKDILKNAFGENPYNEKEILNKIYKSTDHKTLPSVIDSLAKEYPELEKFKSELIAALEDDE